MTRNKTEPSYTPATAEDIAAERRKQAQARIDMLKRYSAEIERLETKVAEEQAENRRLDAQNERMRAALMAAEGYGSTAGEIADRGRTLDEKG
ncbi:hypothetical protein D7Z54_34110 [Salibacterium salarium]|uniref:Uncharacterized protein n=1 Tax=Salibacterium salarium TaxID=284579 RepID=A0A428MSF5_9BACI|nr:hypothetical protein [Salibacterium salarium]RSL28893.1 hypothetical protein D7Z54_34110 [Salibacterium salarium]